jgi:hypothetical protein
MIGPSNPSELIFQKPIPRRQELVRRKLGLLQEWPEEKMGGLLPFLPPTPTKENPILWKSSI